MLGTFEFGMETSHHVVISGWSREGPRLPPLILGKKKKKSQKEEKPAGQVKKKYSPLSSWYGSATGHNIKNASFLILSLQSFWNSNIHTLFIWSPHMCRWRNLQNVSVILSLQLLAQNCIESCCYYYFCMVLTCTTCLSLLLLLTCSFTLLWNLIFGKHIIINDFISLANLIPHICQTCYN